MLQTAGTGPRADGDGIDERVNHALRVVAPLGGGEVLDESDDYLSELVRQLH